MQEATKCYSALFIFKLTKTNYLFDMRGLWPEELISSGRFKDIVLRINILKGLKKVVFIMHQL